MGCLDAAARAPWEPPRGRERPVRGPAAAPQARPFPGVIGRGACKASSAHLVSGGVVRPHQVDDLPLLGRSFGVRSWRRHAHLGLGRYPAGRWLRLIAGGRVAATIQRFLRSNHQRPGRRPAHTSALRGPRRHARRRCPRSARAQRGAESVGDEPGHHWPTSELLPPQVTLREAVGRNGGAQGGSLLPHRSMIGSRTDHCLGRQWRSGSRGCWPRRRPGWWSYRGSRALGDDGCRA
jgi:hypothetical protein